MPSQKAHKTGSSAPDPPAPGVLRVYSMRFCPYAHRTLYTLSAKGIEYETVNVCTVNKPEWFFDINPLAKVPTLQHDDKIVYESLVCNEYLDQVFPGRKMLPEDPLDKARIGMLQAIFDTKIANNFYSIPRKDQEGRGEILKAFKEGMFALEKEISTKSFFGGDEPGFLDYSFYPWFERMAAMEIAAGSGFSFKLQEADFPKVIVWQAAMRDRPEVKKYAQDTKTHLQYFMSRVQGNTNSDIGLQE